MSNILKKIHICLKSKNNTLKIKTLIQHKLIIKAYSLASKFDNSCWKFNPIILHSILAQLNLPQPTIDCFASSINKQCDIYFSLHHDLTNYDTNFLTQHKFPWNAHIAWANPPFTHNTLLKTVQFFIKHNITGYFLTPYWPETQHWKLAKNKSQYIINLPITTNYFSQPTTTILHL